MVLRLTISVICCLFTLSCLPAQNYKVLKTKGTVYYNSQPVTKGMIVSNPALFSFPDCRGAVLTADDSNENYIVTPKPYGGGGCAPVLEPFPYPVREFKIWEKKMLEIAEPQNRGN